MNKFLLFFSSTALLLTGCAKEALTDKNIGDGVQTVTFNVGLAASSTKAVKDGDGAGTKVNNRMTQFRITSKMNNLKKNKARCGNIFFNDNLMTLI